ncbi:MAG: hypothetical protein V1820_03165 [archaeon]
MDSNKKNWLFLPAFSVAWLVDLMNQIGSVLLTVINVLLGATGSPLHEVIFIYVLPFLLIYFTFFDFIYLMGFFRKTTAKIIAAIMALFGARFGVYRQVVDMIGILIGTDKTGTGIWIPMLTFVFVIMAFWWVVGQFLWGWKMTQAINNEVIKVENGIDMLSKIGSFLDGKAQQTVDKGQGGKQG